MRSIVAIPLLLAAGCDVDSDAGNDQVRIDYDQERIENGAAAAGAAAREVASGLGNVAATTGRAVRNEVGDIDVDVDVRRNKGEPGAEANKAAEGEGR